VVLDGDGKPITVRHEAVDVMLLNEFLKEHAPFVEEHRKVKKLETIVANLVATINDQAAQIQKVNARLEMTKPAPHLVSYER
jgi:uncharacterized protein (UPF0305 family)